MTRTIAIALCLGLSGAAALAVEPADGFRRVTPDNLVWRAVPNSFGVESALISGDPAKAGVYVVRVKFPPHVMDRPHRHTGDRHVTVLKGMWYAGTGAKFDPASAVPLKAGSYMFHPANGIHWDGAYGDEEAIVQIIGIGPIESIDVDPALASWVRTER
ncbi:MAG: cupin domain-containing protein [Sandarakinorhabdus sp.]|nr:cupin domain-containing protein [Sandarakinorhabdus sp.]